MFPVVRLLSRLALLLAALVPLLAAADPPARVGRLSLLEGEVLFRTDRQDAGAPATANWPISSGAILDTGRGSRAEIWIGSSAFRLDGGSRVEFTAVDDQHVALQMAQGSLAVTVRDRDQTDDIDIGTPAGQIRFGAPGRYRIDVDEGSGDTRIASRDGLAYVYRPGGELSVSGGQQAVAYARGGWYVADLRPNAFDDWSDARDGMSHAPAARRHVSPYMTGYDDLDRYGSWNSSAEYGSVWYPSAIPAGWAPYRYGRWAWVPPWGWTWIDEAPWGFAPFHYGRWVLIGGQWAWVPGAYTPRPVYAPALVAWVGNPGWSVSFSFGSSPAVGWFPLAPREVFVPAYRCSPTYVRQVNVTNVTNVTVIEQVVAGRQKPVFMHRSLPQAVTVVPAAVVQSGSPVTSTALRQPDRHELAQAPVAARAPGTAWLPPAATALRPRHDNAALSRLAPLQRPENALPKNTVSPIDPASPRPHPWRGEPEERGVRQPSTPTPALPAIQPEAPRATAQPLPPPQQTAGSTQPLRRFNAPFERIPEPRGSQFGRAPQVMAPPAVQSAPAVQPPPATVAPAVRDTPRAPSVIQSQPAPADAAVGTPEPRTRHFGHDRQPENRGGVQLPPQPQSNAVAPAPVVRETPRPPPEPVRTEAPTPHRDFHPAGRPDFERRMPEKPTAPPMAVQVQPASPPHPSAPSPAMREAGSRPMPAPRIEAQPAARQPQQKEAHEQRHEHGKAPNSPQ